MIYLTEKVKWLGYFLQTTYWCIGWVMNIHMLASFFRFKFWVSWCMRTGFINILFDVDLFGVYFKLDFNVDASNQVQPSIELGFKFLRAYVELHLLVLIISTKKKVRNTKSYHNICHTRSLLYYTICCNN